MNELIATIHFIGLALFSTQVPDAPGLHVLLPRVESHQHEAPQAETIDGTTEEVTITTEETRVVEPHQAFIIYDQRDFVEEIGWTPEDVPAHLIRQDTTNPPQYKFVRLTGEQVKFHADGGNATISDLRLPLPRPKCGDGILNGSVAAVVDIPKGELATCAAVFGGSERRYDTQLKLRNSKLIVITAAANGVIKALTLKGSAIVYIANLPAEMLSSGDWESSGAAHYLAYYNLIKTSCAEQGLTAPKTTSIGSCTSTPLSITGDKPSKTVTLNASIVDSECSNSAYP